MFFKPKDNTVTVIIAAAGSGTRMGGVYKPLEMLCGKPVISYSLELFEQNPMVKQIIIASREDKIPALKELCKSCGFTKVKNVIPGGKDRQDSVEKAFCEAFKTKEDVTKLIAIHDAARPLLTKEDLQSVFELAYVSGGATCATRVRDTVKKATPTGFIESEVDRTDLWLMQTPQVFDTDIYHTALGVAKKQDFKVTDDCALVTNAGFKVSLCETRSTNIKLTYAEDMFLAQAILEKRSRGEAE